MANLLDTIKEVLSSPETLSKNLSDKVTEALSSKIIETAATPITEFGSAATESAKALQTVAQKITSGELEAKVNRALTAAETWVALTSGAQLLAAIAAIGIFVVQKKAYDRMTTRRAAAPVRHRKGGRNPRRRR